MINMLFRYCSIAFITPRYHLCMLALLPFWQLFFDHFFTLMKKVIFYFDGFNFYNGIRNKSFDTPHWLNYYWLDFVKFSNQFIDPITSELTKVKYFTAPAVSMQKRLRQSALLNANLNLYPNLFQVINGKFSDKEIDCLASCKETFITKEEKKTDVAIGVTMLLDCYENSVDRLILVSADSDQIPTLKAIKSKFPEKRVQVFFPPNRTSTEIFDLCKPITYLGEKEAKFKHSMLPEAFSVGVKNYSRPEKWKS